MPLQSSGPISLANIATEFSDTAPHSLSEFYRGGAKVSNSAANANVPQSGPISLGNFYGAQSIVEFIVEYLVVAGGGGGGSSYPTSGANYVDGGGGGGGAVSGSFTLNSTKNYLASIGAGGSINASGSASALYNTTDNSTIASTLGGGRGSFLGNSGGVGGSGGGGGGLFPYVNDAYAGTWYGSGTTYPSGAGTAGQGFAGGAGGGGTINCVNMSRGECKQNGPLYDWYGGDGGGANGTPGAPNSSPTSNGLLHWGTYYAAGGDGAYMSGTIAVAQGIAGSANSGNGGSGGVASGGPNIGNPRSIGGTPASGQPGGSGVVVIRYPLIYGTMGTLTGSPQTYTDATYRYYKFTGSGAFGLG